MRPVFARSFVREYQRLPQRFQDQFDKALRFLLSDFKHPALNTHKLKGEYDPEGREIWAARVSEGYRCIFSIDKDEDVYIFYHVGPHDVERRR